MEIYRYAFLFLLGGTIGWIIELFFRRFVSQKKWVNPGFLTGPFLPLYGFGTVGFYGMCSLPWKDWISISWLATITEILSIGVLMTLLEYVAGLIFIKGMKIKLWDYSHRWGNIQGIICPLFSIIWLVIGIIYLFLIHPVMVTISCAVIDDISSLATATIVGFFFGVLTLDFGYSMHLATKIRKAVADSKLVVDWERLKLAIQDYAKKRKEKSPIFFAFSTKVSDLSTIVKEYAERLKQTPKIKALYEKLEKKEDKDSAQEKINSSKKEEK